MRARVFVTYPLPQEAVALLRALATVRIYRGPQPIPRRILARGVRDADGLLCLLTERIDAKLIDGAPRLRAVANCAVGYDNIDVAATTARGIVVTNTPDVLTETSADLAWALLLAAARRLAEGDRLVRSGRWRGWSPDLLVGNDVYGATLGIVGLGRIGSAVARRAHGFQMRVLYWQRRRLPSPPAGARFAPLPRLLAASDFVSLHVPLTPATRGLIGARELGLMKRNAVLVNTSRGGVVDERALVRALSSGRIAAAGLDVYEREPRVSAALTALSNVVLTPHIASATLATRARMAVLAARNLAAALAGREPPNRVEGTEKKRHRRQICSVLAGLVASLFLVFGPAAADAVPPITFAAAAASSPADSAGLGTFASDSHAVRFGELPRYVTSLRQRSHPRSRPVRR